MSNYILQNLNFIIFSSVLFLTILFIIILFSIFIKIIHKDNISVKFNELHLKIREEIKYAVTPKFINVSAEVNEITDLAVEIWRIEQRIAKSASSLSEQQLMGLDNSVQKLKRYLSKYDIEILDYKNTKYNDGLNLDILSIEKNSSLPEPIIKEIIEPTIMCKGQVVRKAKIILINNH
ncbi:MAG: hypothetical protein PHE59_03610 [Patescibacteria group bacterium]|nr:hypothetical protein [Patescibacteria group bacterium]MDD5163994.1 hypothetical protein [Patescibacteria group bacterium]MDD5534922.1 hypothetical protein [Patescibacteria group bacterium]